MSNLNCSIDFASLRIFGSPFKILGPTDANEHLWTGVVLDLITENLSSVVDLSVLLCGVIMILMRYSGARPLRHLYIRRAILFVILSGTLSQWSSFFKGVTQQNICCLYTILQAVFCSLCNLSIHNFDDPRSRLLQQSSLDRIKVCTSTLGISWSTRCLTLGFLLSCNIQTASYFVHMNTVF